MLNLISLFSVVVEVLTNSGTRETTEYVVVPSLTSDTSTRTTALTTAITEKNFTVVSRSSNTSTMANQPGKPELHQN